MNIASLCFTLFDIPPNRLCIGTTHGRSFIFSHANVSFFLNSHTHSFVALHILTYTYATRESFVMVKKTVVGFGVFTAVVLKSTIFWDMTPCSPLSYNRRFGGTYRLHLQGRRNRFGKSASNATWLLAGLTNSNSLKSSYKGNQE
jgi:hypothetical protein